MSDEEKKDVPTLNGIVTTPEKIEEAKQSLPGNQRIFETKDNPGEFKVLTRFQE